MGEKKKDFTENSEQKMIKYSVRLVAITDDKFTVILYDY